MSPDKLVRMINQIAQFHARRPQDEAAELVSTHLKRYWDPRMRAEIIAYADGNGDGLSPVACRAIERLVVDVPRAPGHESR
jgi:formate dehydrogenase subunit delta